MAADSSFDIVSKVDRQEVDNALNQTQREISQRFDFKNTGASIDWQGDLGVYGEVVWAGQVQLGDPVHVSPVPAAAQADRPDR